MTGIHQDLAALDFAGIMSYMAARSWIGVENGATVGFKKDGVEFYVTMSYKEHAVRLAASQALAAEEDIVKPDVVV